SCRTRHKRGADSDANRRQDITLFAIGILQKQNTGIAVRVILNSFNYTRNIVFVALEVDNTIVAFVTAANVANCQTTLIVASASLSQWSDQTLLGRTFGNVREVVQHHAATTWRGGIYFFNRHFSVVLHDN